MPESFLKKRFAFSRVEGEKKTYVQDRLLEDEEAIAGLITDPAAHIYVCGLRGMEEGVEAALTSIAETIGVQWASQRDIMREEGRYHVETY